jgi:hypothetical protein
MYEFAEYSNYDGLWLAELVRNRKVKPFVRIGDEPIRSRRKPWLASVPCFFPRLRHLSVSRRASGSQGRVVGNHQQRERPFDENAAMYRRID